MMKILFLMTAIIFPIIFSGCQRFNQFEELKKFDGIIFSHVTTRLTDDGQTTASRMILPGEAFFLQHNKQDNFIARLPLIITAKQRLFQEEVFPATQESYKVETNPYNFNYLLKKHYKGVLYYYLPAGFHFLKFSVPQKEELLKNKKIKLFQNEYSLENFRSISQNTRQEKKQEQACLLAVAANRLTNPQKLLMTAFTTMACANIDNTSSLHVDTLATMQTDNEAEILQQRFHQSQPAFWEVSVTQ